MGSDSLSWRPLIGADRTKAGTEEAIEPDLARCDPSESLFKRLLRRLFPDQRKQERIPAPPLVCYLGSVRSTKPYKVGDISLSGFCLLTEERWSPGTEMPVTLEQAGADDLEPEYFTVQATVVRCADDGVGFSILLSESDSNAAHGNSLKVKWASAPAMRSFLRSLDGPPSSPAQVRNKIATVQASEASFEVRHAALTQTGSD